MKGEQRGKGGVSLKPSLTAPADIYFPAGSHLENPHAAGAAEPNASVEQPQRTRLPREDGTDIGISSPVPLSDEAVGVITKLRNLKDQDEDYSRWRDVIFKAKVAEARNAQSNDRSEGLDARASRRAMEIEAENSVLNEPEPQPGNHHVNSTREEPISSAPPEPVAADDDGRYCKECFLPLHPDPQPDRLFIFLHAWRYTTKEWSFKTDMPFWAAKGYQWQHSPKGAGALPGEAFSPGSDPAKAFDEITPELSSLGKESVVGLDA
ncbi:hypothetical protein DL93DRAFT_1281753 [Clavulina sp. PMI_390]|nr:hypothetical protein DL93DRAFT_1281753 [Clavulina sp. PMI_390]